MNPDDYIVNYNDEKLTGIKTEQAQKEAEIDQTYNNMINNSDAFYQEQINASKEYADKQSQLQQQNTDLAIEKINQEKEKAEKDYTKEQKASYADFQKQTNKYGVNAEQMAASGLTNSGYSESSNVSMYNTYQNRVTSARESYNQAVLNYNNSIKEAQLANNSALAEISFNALQQQLELSLQGFQYKNSLLQTKIDQINSSNARYDNMYQNMLSQINAELDRKRQIDEAQRQYELTVKQFEEEQKQREEESRQAWKKIELQEQQMKQDQANWEKEYALSKEKTYSSINDELVVSENPQKSSPKYSNYEKMVNVLMNDLETKYKNYSDNFRIQVKDKIKDRLATGYYSGEITDSELAILLNKAGIS